MVRVKNENILNQLSYDYDRYNLTPANVESFCEEHKYDYAIIKLDEDGLEFFTNDGSLFLDFMGEYIFGSGVFSNYEATDNNEKLFNELDKYLDKVDLGNYDLIFINDTSIKIPRR